MSQLVTGLAHCHKMGVLHLDLKPQNVLVKKRDGHLDVKLADFGAAWEYQSDETGPTREVITHWYRLVTILHCFDWRCLHTIPVHTALKGLLDGSKACKR